MRKYGKAIAATVGALAEASLAMFAPHSLAWNVAELVVAGLSIFGVYQTRNTPKPPEGVDVGRYAG